MTHLNFQNSSGTVALKFSLVANNIDMKDIFATYYIKKITQGKATSK